MEPQDYLALAYSLDVQDAEEAQAIYTTMAETIQREWVGQSLTTANITSMEYQCKNIEHMLNYRFGHRCTYEVLLYLNESSHCVEMGYRIKPDKDPEFTLPSVHDFRGIMLQGFTRLLPKY